MIRLTVEAGSILEGSTIDELQDKYDMDIVLHGNGKEMTVHPSGDICVEAGESLVIFALHHRVMEIVSRNRPKRRQVMSQSFLGRYTRWLWAVLIV